MANRSYTAIEFPEPTNISPSYYKIFKADLQSDDYGIEPYRADVNSCSAAKSMVSTTNAQVILFDFTQALTAGKHYTHVKVPIFSNDSTAGVRQFTLQILFGERTDPVNQAVNYTIDKQFVKVIDYSSLTMQNYSYLDIDIDYTVPVGKIIYPAIRIASNVGVGFTTLYLQYMAKVDSTYGNVYICPNFALSKVGNYGDSDTISSIYYNSSGLDPMFIRPFYLLQTSLYQGAVWAPVTAAYTNETILVKDTDFTISGGENIVNLNNIFDNNDISYATLGSGSKSNVYVNFTSPVKLAYFYRKVQYANTKVFLNNPDTSKYVFLKYLQYKSSYLTSGNVYMGYETDKIYIRYYNPATNSFIYSFTIYKISDSLLDANYKFYPGFSATSDKIFISEDGVSKYIYKIIAYDANDNEIAGSQLISNLARQNI